ncbi:MAG TPA: tetratricopeptide repeat protein [Spirochaetota bacterium]|nr:tetratricopeptide repeat protein [Spirochaetota bacterium]
MKNLQYILILIFISSALVAQDVKTPENVIKSIISQDKPSKAVTEESNKQKQEITSDKNQQDNLQKENETKEDQNLKDDEVAEDSKEEKKLTMSGKDEILFKTGIQLFETSMYDHSLAKFKELLNTYPSSKFADSAHIWLGKIYIRKYQYDDAIREFDSVKENSGEYPASLYYKGDSYKLKGDSIKAIENYNKLAGEFPENDLADNAIINIGKLYLAESKGYQALEAGLKIVKYYKDSESIDDAYYLIGKVYEKDSILKDIELAHKYYRMFLKKAENKEKYFVDSPLLQLVKSDIQFLEKTYFKSER